MIQMCVVVEHGKQKIGVSENEALPTTISTVSIAGYNERKIKTSPVKLLSIY
jgi:hypothetical protein